MPTSRRLRRAAALTGAALALGAPLGAAAAPPAGRPGVQAFFTHRSYAPGETASLVIAGGPQGVSLQLFRVGRGSANGRADDVLAGDPVTRPRALRGAPRSVSVPVGDWPSGLYFARLTNGEGLTGYAVFVVRPRRLGEHRIAVVLPTNTWQAYNFRDEDTWYANPKVGSVDLQRPFLDRGVPPHFRGYDRGFLTWLASSGKTPDFLSDDDLQAVRSGDQLAHAYDLVIFSGHEEYVTGHAYDVVERFRNLGGNLAFLSANNFFYRVDHRGGRLYRTGRWRDTGRPEARLVGVQYLDWNEGKYKNAPYVVTGVEQAPWLFAGTGLHDGDRFGNYGIEIDARTPLSPPGIHVLARIVDVFGAGRSAEMTYYVTPRGAKVFAAGSINFGGSARWPVVSRLLENLWRELSRP